jgi:uncharacterized membrane protein (GlpM family)
VSAPSAERDGRPDEIEVKAGKLRETRARDWLIRFGFGAGVSALAGIVAAVAGPRVGGVFLAFPAILLASLTLVAKEDGVRQSRNEARGATYGTLGLVVFALTATVLVGRSPVWEALVVATIAWTLAALAGYFIARRLGHGGDEPAA